MATAARLSARRSADLSTVLSVRRTDSSTAGTTTLSTSPTARAADTSMLNKMRAVLSSHQCVSQQEAVSACMKAAKAQPSAVPVASPCSNYIDQLRYCELVTVQHNYPAVGTSFLF